MTSANVKITTELKSPKEQGVHYRLICMTGPNKGKVYYLTGNRVVIGRGEKVDIQILDSKISREHAELTFANNTYVITDLSNQNGIVVNDGKVQQKKLMDGEKIVLGQTVIKFNIIDIKEESKEIVPSNENVISLKGKNKKVEEKEEELEEEASSTSTSNKPKKNNLIYIIIGLAVVGFFLMDSGDNPQDKKTRKKPGATVDEAFNLESEASQAKRGISKEDPEVKRKFDMLIHSGRREFREGNYYRAMEEFRRADLLIPGSGMAGYLMSRAKQSLEEDVQKNLKKAEKELDAKKFQSAIVSYCGVMQMLQKNPENENYKFAEEKIRAIEQETGMEKGEVKCFEEKSADSKN